MFKNILLTLLLIWCASTLISQNYYINEDFNNATLPTNWYDTTLSGNFSWSFGIDASATDPGNNNIDGTALAFFDDDSYGGSNLNNTVQLYSPVFDNSNDSVSFLEFDYNFRQFTGINDYFKVEIFDGSSWQTLLNETSDNCGRWVLPACTNNFPHFLANISSYKNPNCQIRFTYHDGNDWGWYVGMDNVQTYTPFNNDLKLGDIFSPADLCSPEDTLSVRVYNNGFQTVNGFGIAYQIANNAIVTNTSNASILPGDSIDFKFNAALNRSAFSNSQPITIYLNNNDDELSNDTINSLVPNRAITNIPYIESFEQSSHTWTTGGTNSSWARGVPSSTLLDINTAPEGSNAFVTNLNGTYNNNETSYLTSSCFSFSNINNPILLSFYLNHVTEITFDQCWMEYSTNQGNTWQKLNAGSYSKNWYNNTNANVWEGNSNGWLQVQNSLDGFQNLASVKFRFVFNSDGSTTREGIGIDLFSVFEIQGTDALLQKINFPSNDTNNQVCPGLPNPFFIQAEIFNQGSDTLNDFVMNFQKQGAAIVSDTVQNFNLPPLQSRNYSFVKPFTFNANQIYPTNIWIDANNDQNSSNDSIKNYQIDTRANNGLIQLPYYEDFNSFPEPLLANGWSTSTGNNPSYRWESQSGSTPSSRTGPLGDHNGNGVIGNGVYIYSEASFVNGTDSIFLETPCILLDSASYYELVFDYHKYGSDMGDLYIDIYDGVSWFNGIDLIQGQTHQNQTDPWLTRTVNLSSFKNKVIKIRFRATYGGGFMGDMAIDNIILRDTVYTNLSLDSLIEPQNGCGFTSSELITVKVTNKGFQDLLPNSTTFSYSLDSQTFIREPLLDTIPVDSSYLFTFNQTADLSTNDTLYNFTFAVYNQNDIISIDDTIIASVSNYSVALPYVEDFEDPIYNVCQNNFNILADLPRDWSTYTNYTSSNRPFWMVQNDSLCNFGITQGATESNYTGPSSAFSGNRFLYFEASRSNLNSIFSISSSCFQLPNQNNLLLEFYYFMYGQAIGRLNIDIVDLSGNVFQLDSIIGQVQTSNTDPWLKRTIPLDSFKNEFIKVRFTVSYDSSHTAWLFEGDIAIDSIAIYNSLSVDVESTPGHKNDFNIYPNPSQGQYFIQSIEDLNGVEYQIYNLQSKLIQSGKLTTGKNQINLSDQSKGIYLLQIEKYGIRQKLIKY